MITSFFTEKDRKSDFTTVLSPALNLAFTSKNMTLSVGYRGSAQFYSEHPEADGYFQSLSFNIDLPILNRQIRGLEVKVFETASYSPELPAYSFGNDETDTEADERFNQVLLEGEGVQQSGRVDTFRNRAGISLRYPFWKNFSVHASYTNVITRYSGNEFDNTVVHVVDFGGDFSKSLHWPTKRTEWTVSYDSSLAISDDDDDTDWVHRLNFGVQHLLSRLLTANGGLGIAFPEGESPQLTLSAGISKRYKTGDMNLRYTSNVATGIGVIRGLTRRQSVIGTATRALSQRISSFIQAGYVSNRSFEGNQVNVASYTAGTGLSMRLLSWLNGSLNYSYLNQQSEGNLGEDGERNVASITFTAVGPSWRMMK